MTSMLIAGTVWIVVGLGVALLVARVVHLAELRSDCTEDIDGSPTYDDQAPIPLTRRGTGLPGPRRPSGKRRSGTPVG
jgi:hypothetical protein